MNDLNTILNYNFENFLHLKIDISKLDDYYLNIFIKAIETEINLRNPNLTNIRIETKKTVIFIDIIHLCLGKLSNKDLEIWRDLIYTEYNKRQIENNNYEDYLNNIDNYIRNVDSINKDLI